MSGNPQIADLRARYIDGELHPREFIEDLINSISSAPDSHIWINLLTLEQLNPCLELLECTDPESLPLYGIPFAIKDNIDLAGIPTTAACKEFAYTPDKSAVVVDKLIAAGAIPIGKTNMDQFATGLVGTRSPYGTPANPLADDRVPGGSSSGSAVAVSTGRVCFSLGTDTAGSGRIPAAFNNIWGLKPSCGRLSTSGVVPACRTLDCVSIFANSAIDCEEVLSVIEGYDESDPFSKKVQDKVGNGNLVIGIPREEDLMFFGDAGYSNAWTAAVEEVQKRGWKVVPIDFTPFLEAAKLLYEGPWVAERYAALERFIEKYANLMYPATRQIICAGRDATASEAFNAKYALAGLKRMSDLVWDQVDAIITPTAGGFPKLDEVKMDPFGPNSQLGYYTNFMNLLDLCAVAAPAGFTDGNLPFGITWIAPSGHDRMLLQIASAEESILAESGKTEDQMITLLLLGAHMEGLALNESVVGLGARFNRTVRTAPLYKMLHLESPAPPRPGIVRIGQGGAFIQGELWDFPLEALGSFLKEIHQPLGLGEIELEDGSMVHGFLCESAADSYAEDISEFGGWRTFLSGK